MRLLVGDDWAEDHHDVELQAPDGKVLRRARLPEGVAGVARLHEMVADAAGVLGCDPGELEVQVGIETDRGLWVAALLAAGYVVFAVNPLQAARYRDRLSVSGAKADRTDAHMLADMVRTDAHQLRTVAADSAQVEAIKVVTRAHKTLIWERTRAQQRLRFALRDYFPAALQAFEDLHAPDVLELLGKAPDPASAARLTLGQVTAALKRARRRNTADKAAAIRAALRSPQLAQPAAVTAAYAVTTRASVAVLTTLNEQIDALAEAVQTHFLAHPAAEIVMSQPGLGPILGARVLAEFGDAPDRYANAKARKNFAGTSPVTRQSGKKKTVMARWVHNDRLIDALCAQAFAALAGSPGARAYYDTLRARGTGHRAALRQLANRLVGILHGCLKTGSLYDETTAWAQHTVTDIAA
jgi:transposase